MSLNISFKRAKNPTPIFSPDISIMHITHIHAHFSLILVCIPSFFRVSPLTLEVCMLLGFWVGRPPLIKFNAMFMQMNKQTWE